MAPPFLMDVVSLEPAVAGAGSSIFQILAIVGALGVPLAVKFTAPRTVAIVLGALWLAVPVGLLLAPRLWWLWAGSGGVAQGGGITLIFLAIIRLARDQATAGRMSAIVQGVGYCLAALAPTAIGYVHTRTGNWAAPLLVILCSVAVFITGTTLSLRKMPGHR